MKDDFISVYDAMPPLNVFCECKLKNRDCVRNARFIHDNITNKYWFARVADKDDKFTGTKEGTFLHVSPVSSWRALESKEDGDEWLRQLSKYSVNDFSSDMSTLSDLSSNILSEV